MGFLSAVGRFFSGKQRVAPTSESPPALPVGGRVSTPPPSRSPVDVQWAGLKAYVAHCERERLALARLQADDPVAFFHRRWQIEQAVRSGIPLDRAAREAGFLSGTHWQGVERYFDARYSQLVVAPDGSRQICFVEQYQRARVLAEQERAQAAAQVEADRDLEPIQGVSLERFAEISATLVVALKDAGGASRSELSAVLAQFNVGPAVYGRTRRGWMERIERDTSGRLKKLYAETFKQRREQLMANASSGVMPRPGAEAEEDILRPAAMRRTWVDVG